MLAHGFAAGLPEILAVTHLGNDASQKVCRRIGMRHQGVVEKWYDLPSELFRITSEEWLSAPIGPAASGSTLRCSGVGSGVRVSGFPDVREAWLRRGWAT